MIVNQLCPRVIYLHVKHLYSLNLVSLKVRTLFKHTYLRMYHPSPSTV
jgi:hypothetical protein